MLAQLGAVEYGHSVIVRSLSSTTAVVTQAEWFSVENLTDKARIVFQERETVILG